ncbi:MAG TPA: DUF6448 family protein [Gemmatimonadaceae bacterium]|nr:DUF6448 family protein [Gemmatimonadaceae bacterium]
MFAANIIRTTVCLAVLGLGLGTPSRALGHCDGLDGPVVQAARQALESRDVARALLWVQERDEPEIRQAFERALVVRALGPQARELADHFFFETLVRIHRAGEGAPYTGLKPAGRDLGPAIPAADQALVAGSIERVEKLLVDAMLARLRDRFHHAAAASRFSAGDVAGGREYVRAYVEFIHYVERLYEAATTDVHGHVAQPDAAAHEHEP